jgi:hypothetical protein
MIYSKEESLTNMDPIKKLNLTQETLRVLTDHTSGPKSAISTMPQCPTGVVATMNQR